MTENQQKTSHIKPTSDFKSDVVSDSTPPIKQEISIKKAVKILECFEEMIKIKFIKYNNKYKIIDKGNNTITTYTEKGFIDYFNDYCNVLGLKFIVLKWGLK